jgi:hypothetical protein
MERVMLFAKTYMHRIFLDDMGAAEQLKMARLFRTQEWILPALHLYFTRPLMETLCDDMAAMTPAVCLILSKAHTALMQARIDIASYPPPLQLSPDDPTRETGPCHSHPTCKRLWHDVWMQHISRRVLQPTGIKGNANEALSIGGIPAAVKMLENLYRSNAHKKMNFECHQKAVQQLESNGFIDRIILDQVVSAVAIVYDVVD